MKTYEQGPASLIASMKASVEQRFTQVLEVARKLSFFKVSKAKIRLPKKETK